jgi:general secretion pathway protein J
MIAAGRPDSGFTLVEMLVALTIFALLAAAGVGLLRSSVDTQAAVEGRLMELAGLGRAQALLASDIGQLVDRPTIAGTGLRPAFIGDSTRMEFVRVGWSNLDGEQRSELQRVVWQGIGGILLRGGYARIDGDSDEQAAAILRSAQANFRYRSADGGWSSQFQASPDRPFPTAIELTVSSPGGPPTTLIFATAAAGAGQ